MQFIAQRFFNARKTYTHHATIQNAMQDKLLELLPKKEFRYIFEFGAGTGIFTQKIINQLQYKYFLCNDINDYANYYPPIINFLCFDMNQVKNYLMAKTFDLIISNACVQWLKQEEFFKNLDSYSTEGSLLAISSFGKDNLYEIKKLTQKSLHYLSLEEYKNLLSSKWKILHLFDMHLSLKFDTALQAFRHLKLTGTNSLDKSFLLNKKILQNLSLDYNNTLTYHPIYLIAQRT